MMPPKSPISAPLSSLAFITGIGPYSVNLAFPQPYIGRPIYCHASVNAGVLFLDISDKHTEDRLVSGTTASSIAVSVTFRNTTLPTTSVPVAYNGSDLWFGVQVSYPDMKAARLVIEPARVLTDPDTLMQFVAVQNDQDSAWYDMAWVNPQFIVKNFARLLDASVVEPPEAIGALASAAAAGEALVLGAPIGRASQRSAYRDPRNIGATRTPAILTGSISGPIGVATPP